MAGLRTRRRWPAWPPIEARDLVLVAVLALLIVLVAYPIAMVVANSFQVSRPGVTPVPGLEGWRIALTERGMRESIVNTLAILSVHTLISMPIAVLIAWLLARTDIPRRGWLEFLFWIPFFLPSLAVTLAWIIVLDPHSGLLNTVLARVLRSERGPFDIYSFWGIVWVHLASTAVATKVMLLTPLFRSMDAGLEEASRVCGATKVQTFVRIVVPLMVPAIVVVLTLAVLYGLQAFEIELILGGPINLQVYSTKIYNLLHQEPPLFAPATALSALMLLLIVPLLVLQRRVIARAPATLTGCDGGRVTTSLGAWRYPALAFVVVTALLVTVVPVVFLLMGTFMKLFGFFDIPHPWTVANWSRVFGDPIFLRSLRNTLMLGIGAGLVAVCLFSLVAYLALRSRAPARAVLDFLAWLPVALPGVLVGIGLLWVLLANSLLQAFYGTIPVLVVATVITGMAIGTQLIKSNVALIGPDLEDAARVAGASWFHGFRTIVLPLMKPVLMLVGTISFTHAARDISSVALLATANSRPLSLLQLDYLAAGQYESALVVAALLMALSIGCASLARVWGTKLRMWP